MLDRPPHGDVASELRKAAQLRNPPAV
jgi:hypothetical protein